MTSAFQSDAFQTDAFQIDASGASEGHGSGAGAGAGVGSSTVQAIGSGAGVGEGTGVSVATHAAFWTTTAQGYVDRSFGMFIHFGIETFEDVDEHGTGELGDGTAPETDFDPGATVDPEQWVLAAVDAGMQYAVMTVKHVDGWCNWITATTTYGIADSTWYANNGQRDLVREFVDACYEHNIVPHFYFAAVDYNYELTHSNDDATAYRAFILSQLSELLTNYGDIASIWLDACNGYFPGHAYPFPWTTTTQRINDIHALQATCLSTDNNQEYDLAESEVVIYEGGGVGTPVPDNNTDPAEKCDTIRGDNYWFFKVGADTPLNKNEILSALIFNNNRNAAFLLNVPPNRSGLIESAHLTILSDVGDILANPYTGNASSTGTGTGIGKSNASAIGSGAGVGTGHAGTSSVAAIYSASSYGGGGGRGRGQVLRRRERRG